MADLEIHSGDKLLLKLTDSSNRAILHAIILFCGAGLLLAGVLWWQMSNDIPVAVDKVLHYRGGQFFSVIIFYLAYLCIIVRVLLVGRSGGSTTRVLLWLPAMIALALLLSIAGVFLVAFLKEFFDFGGGSMEWQDIKVSLDGAMTIVPFVGIIMALTPIFIPLDIFMQLPRLLVTDIQTGISSLDGYVNELKWHNRGENPPAVLVVEDDIDCAAVTMNFCRNVGLRCHHVSSATEGLVYLYDHYKELQLLLLDNFLRVDSDGCNMTGSELLVKIDEEFPAKERNFFIVMITGHTELINDVSSSPDMLLQKPWSPEDLLGFLKNKKIIK